MTLAEARALLATAEQERDGARAELVGALGAATMFREERDAARDQLADADRKIKWHEAQADRLFRQLATVEKERDDARAAALNCSTVARVARDELDAVLAKLAASVSSEAAARAELATAERRRDEALAKLATARDHLAIAWRQHDVFADAATAELAQLREENATLARILDGARASNEAATDLLVAMARKPTP